MGLNEWRILAIVFFAISIILILVIKANNLLDNKYNYNCREDKIVKTKRKGLTLYNVYEVSGRSASYIDKYVISKKGSKHNLICDYTDKYNYISFYVLLFNKHKKLMKIMEVSENGTANCSKAIKLPKKALFLNIVVNHVNDEDLGINLKGEVSLTRLKVYAAFESLVLFFFLFAVRHLLIELICLHSNVIFLWSDYNIYSIIILIIFTFINYLVVMSKLKVAFQHKKAKVRKEI